jgi:Domain of unknown function (DUF4437)
MSMTTFSLASSVARTAVAVVAALALPAFSASHAGAPAIRLTPADQIKYQPLDPKAGAAGPQVAVVFGQMNKKAPIGILLKTPAGFKPGPHLHTSDNHVVVVRGTAHNFAAGGPEGSGIGPGGTWFQPGNADHDNHCTPTAECLLFVYLPKGFDFKPPKSAAKK